MAFTYEIHQPSNGWMDTGELFLKPPTCKLFKEAFSRIIIFKTRKKRFSLIGWAMAIFMLPLSFRRLPKQHLAITTFPEEIYLIPHRGYQINLKIYRDPYNPMCGFMYCKS
jgi:hypothetical protein